MCKNTHKSINAAVQTSIKKFSNCVQEIKVSSFHGPFCSGPLSFWMKLLMMSSGLWIHRVSTVWASHNQIIRANQPAPGKSVDCFSYLHNTFNENKPLWCQEEQFTSNCNKWGRSPFKKGIWSLSSLFINRQQEFSPRPCIDIFPTV